MTEKLINYKKIFLNGLWYNNQGVFALLGLCPLLAVSNTTINALGMGIATLCVLLMSNTLTSISRFGISHVLRIPIFVTIIAGSVTIIDLSLNAWWHDLHQSLGIFVPLIVTNCIILARADGYASKNSVDYSIVDALGMGMGFLIVIVILGMVRELIGQGSLFSNAELLFGDIAQNWEIQIANFKLLIALFPAGAFFALGLLIGCQQYLSQTLKNRTKQQQTVSE